MNKTELEEKTSKSIEDFFTENLFADDFSNAQLSCLDSEIALEKPLAFQNEEFLDKCLAAIKFVFLYIPGTMAINVVGTFAYVFILYRNQFPNFVPEAIGLTIVGTFLTMLGIGKLKDLSYLKIPASVFASSILFSILHAIFAILTGDEFFGFFFFSSFPIVAFVGYLVKRMLDKSQ